MPHAWNPSTDNSGSVTYVVNKDGQGFTVPQGQTTYTIDWLSPGRTYNFYVAAYDKAFNQSPPSGTVMVTTPRDTSPPTAPVLTGIRARPLAGPAGMDAIDRRHHLVVTRVPGLR